MSQSQEFNFTVDSALLGELGEKLVSTVHVALTELVKNAYDADATVVRVTIQATDGIGPSICIEDNGVGMTPTQVQDYWMRIGTTNKADSPTSSLYGRPKTGRKGVGRFACRRLGRTLHLETSAKIGTGSKNSPATITKVDFNWDEFIPGTTVESINCTGELIKGSSKTPTGTRLVIAGAPSDEWRTRGYNYLRRQLAVVANNRGVHRDGFLEDPGFRVELVTPEKPEEVVDLREAVMEASWGTLEGKVADDGRAELTLRAFGIGGKRTFTTQPIFRLIRGASLKIGILPVNANEGVRNPKLLANYVLTNLIDEWGGIQVRHNGFRMYPYGNPGDDWLEIDSDRGRRLGRPQSQMLLDFAQSIKEINPSRVLLNMLGMRNYLGQVDVSSDIPALEPRLDRQGFIDSPAFSELIRFVRFAIEWATIHREAYIRQRATAEAKEAVAQLAPILKANPRQLEADATPRAAKYLRQEISRLVTNLPENEQVKTQESLLRTVNALEAISTESQSQLRHLRLLASASTLTLLFAHEVRSSIASLGAGSARLRGIAQKIQGPHKEELRTLAAQLSASQSQLVRLVDMTGIVGAFRNDQQSIEVHLYTALEKSISCFRLVLENYDISVDISSVKASLFVGPMPEGEIYSIFINLISNAIKSLIAAAASNKKIEINAMEMGKKVIIRISDNGLGLDPIHFAEVFTPFISDPSGDLYKRLEKNANPEDAAAFGTGSGLGLSISRDIAKARGGDVRFVLPDTGWSATVEVELP